jgi:hypothetical protein
VGDLSESTPEIGNIILEHQIDDDDGQEGVEDDVEDEGREALAFENQQRNIRKKNFGFAPEVEEVMEAMKRLAELLRPPRDTGYGYKESSIQGPLRKRLEDMERFAKLFVRKIKENPEKRHWMTALREAAQQSEHVGITQSGKNRVENLRLWLRALIKDRTDLPVTEYKGGLGRSVLDDEDIAQDIKTHLQGIGKYVQAQDLLAYLATPEMKERLHRTRPYHICTAHRWMRLLGFCWVRDFRGQYADGHECKDVVDYRRDVFIPRVLSTSLGFINGPQAFWFKILYT